MVGNRADRGGGLGLVDASQVDLVASKLRDNAAEGLGGGVYAFGFVGLAVAESEVVANRAAVGGGLYFSSQGSFELRGSEVAHNLAARDAGVVLADQHEALVVNSVIRNNIATEAGVGGLATRSETLLQIERSLVTGNKSEGLAGGFMTSLSTSTTFRSTAVSDNRSSTGAGGIAIGGERVDLLLVNTTVSGNHGLRGGGIGVLAASELGHRLWLRHSTIANNQALQGGGLALTSGALGSTLRAGGRSRRASWHV